MSQQKMVLQPILRLWLGLFSGLLLVSAGGRVRADQQSLTAHRQTEDFTARHWLPPVAPRPHRL